jgi:ubiquinone/menaquinone biosynthesis C-methylase UbiE
MGQQPDSGNEGAQVSTFHFDAIAERFDRRAALPEQAADAVAEAVMTLASVTAGQRVVEIGPGTGQLGARWIARGARYTGIDSSQKMLEVFAERLGEVPSSVELRFGDANQAWPVADRDANLVFLSRVAHLLAPEHVGAQATRVLVAGGGVIAARRRTESGSVRATVRREVRKRLAARGLQGKERDAGIKSLSAALEQAGFELSDPLEAARWPVTQTPREALDAWCEKTGLAGISLDEATKAEVIEEMRSFCEQHFGDLDTPVPSEESFMLHYARLNRAD